MVPYAVGKTGIIKHRMRVGFVYNTQNHQILHSLPIALELSALRPDWRVDLLMPTDCQLDYIRSLLPLYPDARVSLIQMDQPWLVRLYQWFQSLNVPPKVWTLIKNRRRLNRYDALILTDKTGLWMRRFGVTRPKLVNTEHGAGDRDVTIDPRVARFDFNLIPSPKTAAQMQARGLLHARQFAVGGYAKFDIVRRMQAVRAPLFDNDRPTILYNPHFCHRLSSWPVMGMRVLEIMAAQDRYNLIFAPHVRLFDPPTPAKYAPFERFRTLPHMRIDLGSDASIDMTYTQAADLYLGDVSSQVYEFLSTPRPCLFLDAHAASWQDNPEYRFWTLGPVLTETGGLLDAIGDALAVREPWRERQIAAFAANFDMSIANPGWHNATLLAAWLSGSH